MGVPDLDMIESSPHNYLSLCRAPIRRFHLSAVK